MGSTLKKVWGLLVIFVFAFIPSMVSATEDGYIEYSNIITNGESFNASSKDENEILIYMKDAVDYSFDLKGYNLVENEIYVLNLSSDFIDYSKEYTGTELMNGINILRDDGNGLMLSQITVKSSNEVLKAKTSHYEELVERVYFRFNYNFDSTEVDAHFKKITSNGKIEVNSIKLDNIGFTETTISASLSKYNTDNFRVFGSCYPTYEDCYLYIMDTRYSNRTKKYKVEYIFQNTDEEILSKVNKYVENFKITSGTVEENLFALDDLENINYKYMIIKHGREDINTINAIVNYSSEIQAMLDYANLTAIIDTRAGWGEQFTAGGFGYLNLLYDNVIYGVADQVGVKQINVLYVDDSTEDTRDAYINRALKRVQDYLPNAEVTLTYAGQIDDLDQTDWIVTVDEAIDVDKTLGEYYTLTIDGTEFSFFIVKDSSKMKNPEMNTVDLKTNIKINSDSYEVPLDAKISANILDKNSKEYKDIISKLKLGTGMVVDLNLYSDLANTYIAKLDNGKFKVFVPVTKEYLNKDLNAYYIKDDGTIEIHKVEIENGYAIFETDHFSTYTIGGVDLNNPDTSDGIIMWIVLVGISVTGLLLSVFKFREKLN